MRLLPLALLISLPAAAQVLSWKDRNGVHYTNDLAAVPKGAKVTRVDDGPPARLQPVRPVELAVGNAVPVSPSNPSVEREWRDRFIQLHRAIATKKQELSAFQAGLASIGDCATQPWVSPVAQGGSGLEGGNGANAQLIQQQVARCLLLHDGLRLQTEQKRVELADAEHDLEQLDRRATFEAVPREWRRGW